MSTTTERLAWIMSQLQKLQDEDRIRNEGWQVFQGAKAELQDIIDHPASEAPAIINQIMTPEAAESMAVSIADLTMLRVVNNLDLAGLATRIEADIQASDAVVLAAVNAKGDDVLAALAPAA